MLVSPALQFFSKWFLLWPMSKSTPHSSKMFDFWFGQSFPKFEFDVKLTLQNSLSNFFLFWAFCTWTRKREREKERTVKVIWDICVLPNVVRVSDLVVLLFHEDLIDDFSGPKLIFTLHAECFAESFGGGGGRRGVNTILPALSTFWKGFGCPGWVLKVVCFSFCWRAGRKKKWRRKKWKRKRWENGANGVNWRRNWWSKSLSLVWRRWRGRGVTNNIMLVGVVDPPHAPPWR